MVRLTTKEFIENAKKVHGDKYDYSKVNYVNRNTKICIICPEHGEFWQTPNNHLKGYGCRACGLRHQHEMHKLTLNDFIERAKKVHGDKYDYSASKYDGALSKIKIICPSHGEFWQMAASHLQGCGCPLCSSNHKHETIEWIKLAEKVHGNNYDYTKTEYVDAKTKVNIVCHHKDKYGHEHGEFSQLPGNHLKGYGCPKCKGYKLEGEIRALLLDNKIAYEEHKTFSWLKNKTGARTIDFFLPAYNVGIECQGIQHFAPTDFANKGEKWAKEKFDKTIQSDSIKRRECEKRNIKIYYFSNLKIEYPYEVFEDKNKLLQKIIENGIR